MARPTSIVCADCGGEVAVSPRGKVPKWCAGCRKAREKAADKRHMNPEARDRYATQYIPLTERLHEE